MAGESTVAPTRSAAGAPDSGLAALAARLSTIEADTRLRIRAVREALDDLSATCEEFRKLRHELRVILDQAAGAEAHR